MSKNQVSESNRPVWLVEAGVYGAEADPLLAEIRRQGLSAAVVSHRAVRDPSLSVDGHSLGEAACVIGYGTFPFAREIHLHRQWKPGAWCNPLNLDCTTYFAHFGRFLLNQQYTILPGVEAIRQRDWLFDVWGRDDKVFVRPTGCHKLFTGRCVARDDFESALAPTRYDPATLVVIASPKVVEREWRLVIAGDRVIASSRYAVTGRKSVESGCPDAIHLFAEGMLKSVRWRPDPVFMADIGEADGHPWLIELNGFSCSWLYACDLAAVVEAASALATATWM